MMIERFLFLNFLFCFVVEPNDNLYRSLVNDDDDNLLFFEQKQIEMGFSFFSRPCNIYNVSIFFLKMFFRREETKLFNLINAKKLIILNCFLFSFWKKTKQISFIFNIEIIDNWLSIDQYFESLTNIDNFQIEIQINQHHYQLIS